MEIKKKYIHMNHEKGQVMSQITLDDDYNLPDYKPDIVKVMKDGGEMKFENIRVNDGHIYVKGTLQFEILYRSDLEDRKLDALSGSIPFEETISMDGIDELDPVNVRGVIEDLSVHIINSRKLGLRALVMLKADVRDVKEEQLVTDITTEDAVEMKKQVRRILQLVTCKKDNLRFKEEFTLPQSKSNVDRILWRSVQLRAVETRVKDSLLQVSGEVLIFLLYYAQGDENRLEWLEEAVPLNGMVSLENGNENQLYQIRVTPTGTELEVKPDYDGEDRNISLDMVLELDICIWNEEDTELLSDVYSLSQEVIPSYEDTSLTRLLAKNYAKCKVNDRMQLDKNQENILQICSCEGEVFIDRTEEQAQGLKVEGGLNVEMMYITTDDAMPIGTYKGVLGFEQFIEVPEAAEHMDYDLQAGLEQLSAVLLDNTQIEVKAVVNLNLMAFENQKIAKITDIEVKEKDLEELQKQPGIIGYIVKEGDDLWSIAKSNHTTVLQLIETNELAGEEIGRGDKLLIVKTV